MARKTIFVSDLTGKTIDEKERQPSRSAMRTPGVARSFWT